jgi:hypothetical protein
MAEKQDPSIYDDRGSIGSSDDLDEYGVWVKSEPQDLSSSMPDIEELPDISGLGDDNAELPDFADFSASESDNLDISSGGGLDLSDDDLKLPDDSLDLPSDDFDLPSDDLDLPDDDLNSLNEMNLDLPNDDSLDLSESEPLDKPFAPASSNNASLDDEDDDLPTIGPLGGVDLEFEELPEDTSLPEKQALHGGDDFDTVSMDDFVDSSQSSPKKIEIGNLDEVVGEGGSKKGSSDLSNQLLMKIADELSSIKKEIASLKSELAGVKGGGGDAKAEADAKGGFFDEEDDEKIALTGDELDNILHTADFIEESGSDEGMTSVLSDDENIISEMPGDTPEDPFATEADLEDSIDLSFDESDFSEESPELNDLRESGAKSFTAPPDDTSYLEADPLADSSIEDDEHIDLSGAVIDEPDLSSQIVENPVFEPELDNLSIDIEPSLEPEAAQGTDDFVFEVEDTMEIGAGEDLLSETDNFASPAPAASFESGTDEIPSNLKQELKTVLSYMDQLLEALPDDKIEEFAKSEYFETYKKLFEELGLT